MPLPTKPTYLLDVMPTMALHVDLLIINLHYRYVKHIILCFAGY